MNMFRHSRVDATLCRTDLHEEAAMKILTSQFLRRNFAVCLTAAAMLAAPLSAARAAEGDLKIEIISAYNLVVDSNVTTPATYAPGAATVGAKICNTTTAPINDVHVYIGDYKDGVGSTPGLYPVFNSAGDSRTWLNNTGTYSLKQESGSYTDVSDASRAWIGTLQAGECKVEYWVISYPQCVNVGGQPQAPPCTTSITGGSTTADDLTLYYDVWATGSGVPTVHDRQGLTLRSEISASANKIWPNGDNKVPAEYKAAIEEAFGWDVWTPTGGDFAYPGQTVRTQGIWYDLGNVNKGFDNNGDGVPDQNAWLQPVGDPSVYDPGCFRLVRTYGILVVKLSGGGEKLIPFENQMYFENIPDNTGAVGLVFYEYAALNGACTGALTPYQEVASGNLNEKFSGDYGAGFLLQTKEPLAFINKAVDPETAPVGSTLTYTMAVSNPPVNATPPNLSYGGLTVTVGDPSVGAPLVIRDKIPTGTTYVAGSAKVTADSGIPASSVTILYSADNGATWSSTVPATVTNLQWVANVGLENDKQLKVEFKVTVPSTGYTAPLVSNTGCAAIGAAPCFDEDDAVTLIQGTRTISGTTFLDNGAGTGGVLGDGVKQSGELIEDAIKVTLYYDANGDGKLDAGDIKWGDTSTDASGAYSFGSLPAGKFIVVVDKNDSDLTAGAVPTTDTVKAADVTSANVTGVNFGFLPPLKVSKTITSSTAPYGDGETITYELHVENILPGGTPVPGGCYYDVFPENTTFVTNTSGGYINPTNLGARDGVYGYADLGTAASDTVTMASGAFKLPAKYDGNITDVNVIFYGSRETGGSVETSKYSTSVTINATAYTSGAADLLISNILGVDHEQNLTANPAPTWAQIAAASAVLTATKNGSPTGNWELDAYALRVYTDKPCAASNSDIITEVKLQDVYNDDNLNYVGSVPAESSHTVGSPNSTLVWNNLGPLAPGESKVVKVTMKGHNPSTSATVTAPNTARVAAGDAKMGDGRIANSDSATVSVDIVPAMNISGTLFYDKIAGWFSTTGDNSAEDAYLPGQTVELWACATTAEPRTPLFSGTESGDCNANTGYEWYPIATTTTAADGSYIFEGVTQGYYFVKAPDSVYGASPTASASDTQNNPTGGDTSPDAYWKNPVDSTVLNTLNGDALNTFFRIGGASGNWTDATNVDFGYGGSSAVSGYIWEDVNGSGTPNVSGEYLSGITVQLIYYGNDGVPGGNGQAADVIVSTITDANGFYQFTGLTADRTYHINVLNVGESGATGALASGAWTSIQETADGTAVNPGNDATIDGAITFIAANNQILLNRNFGYQPPDADRQIDGTIYYDFNNNAQNSGEPGVAGVTVYLYQDEDGDGVVDAGTDALAATTVTGADGKYVFTDLPAGKFLVVVGDGSLSTYQQTDDPDVATGVCVGVQCDSDGKVDVTTSISVSGVDFGYLPPSGGNSMSGQIWSDIDKDKIKDGGIEAGISGVTVTLQWSPDGGITWVTMQTKTASNGTTDVDGDGKIDLPGSYYFGDLPNGNYRVVVSEVDPALPKDNGGATFTPTTGTDSGTTRYIQQTLTGGTSSANNDFGFAPSGAIGDSIFWDANGDGSQGLNEPGIAGVPVNLYTFTDVPDANGKVNGRWDIGEPISATPYATTTTDANGNYMFSGLPDGNYLVDVGAIPGNPNPQLTADPNMDGAICPASGEPLCDGLFGAKINGNTFMGADFGYKPPVVVSGQLFVDTNVDPLNPQRQNGDTPLAFVSVVLQDCGSNGVCGDGDDGPTLTTFTDENGNYSFVNPPVGNYRVFVDPANLPGYIDNTYRYNGHAADSTDDNYSMVTVGPGSQITDVDFGYKYNPASNLSGTVCLEGTGPDGVCGSGTSGVGTGESAYSGIPVYVSKWIDADNDNVIDPGELTALAQTVTGANGDYSFTGLPSVSAANEHYVVSLAAPESHLDLTTKLADVAPNASKLIEHTSGDYTTSAVLVVSTDGTKTGLDFAFERAVQFDFGDLPLPFETSLSIDGARHIVPAVKNLYLGAGVTTEADGIPSVGATSDLDDGVVQVGTWQEGANGGKISVTTYGKGWFIGWIDFNGDGSFSGPGEMIVSRELGVAGESATTPISFNIPDGGLSSPGYARFRFFPSQPPVPALAFKGITENGEVEDYWFQFNPPSSIGDWIGYDSDGDGVPDKGLAGVVVELKNEYCNIGVDCPTATTDANGNYVFSGIGLGTYTVAVTKLPTISGVTTLTQIYDPDSVKDGKTTVTIDTPGTVYLDADFWYSSGTPTATGIIGDRIWNDADGDQKQDMGESGIGGVTVALRVDTNGDGTYDYTATATTAADGSYMFKDVPAGNYIVDVTPPAGATQTGDPDGTKNNSTSGTLAAGQTVLTADFGYQYPTASTTTIGNRVWLDANSDGVQNAGESGIGGVTVVLKNSDGVVIAQTVTDGNGDYAFPGLLPGTYTVEVTDGNSMLADYVPTYEKDSTLNGSHTVTISKPDANFVCSTGTASTPTYNCGNEINFGYGPPKPTYASFSGFAAYIGEGGQTMLEWRTSSEIGTIGFMLERLNRESGAYEPVSEEMLPGLLDPPHGGVYRLADPAAAPGAEQTYQVVEITVQGRGTVSGPHTVKAEQALPFAPGMTAHGPEGFASAYQAMSRGEIRRAAARKAALRSAAAAPKKPQAVVRTLKVPVSQDGLVHLTADQLAAASGMKRNQIVPLLKARKVLLTLEGRRIPVLPAANGAGLWFYGQGPARKDLAENTYRLELGKLGAALASAPAQPAGRLTFSGKSFADRTRLEENHRALHFYNIGKELSDLWAWTYLFASGGKPHSFTQTVDAPHLADGPAFLTAHVVSTSFRRSSGSAAPYKVALFLNDVEVGTAESEEQGDWRVRAEIPHGLLRETGNEVKITSLLNPGVSWSLLHLESIEIERQRLYQVEDGALTFSSGGNSSVTVEGFSGKPVLALEITDPEKPLRAKAAVSVKKDAAGLHSVAVQTKMGRRYLVTEKLGVSGSVAADSPSQLKNVRNQADYLLITTANLMESAKRLAGQREGQGLKTMLVDIEDVRDEFSWSQAAPEAVRAFLSHAHAKWAQAPRYVALVGDGSVDYRNHLGLGRPQVPAELAMTPDGAFPGDNALGDVAEEDGVPEFAVGRIPVFDKAELERYIDKVVAYEQAPPAAAAVFVNDRPDPAAGNFRASADKAAALMPEGIEPVRIDVASAAKYADARNKTFSAMQNGAALVHYIGHSSVVGLGAGNALLQAAQIDALHPAGQPLLMVSMSCSAGFFGYPAMNSFGETALLKADGGAAAFFGASGLSYNHLADIMAEGFYKGLADPVSNPRIGDAAVAAKRHYAEARQGRDAFMLDIYNLIGDPALLSPVR